MKINTAPPTRMRKCNGTSLDSSDEYIPNKDLWKKALSRLCFYDNPSVQERWQVWDQQFYLSVFVSFLTYPPSRAMLFHARPHSTFVETKSNLKRKKLHRMNSDSNFLRGSFSNRDNLRAPIQTQYLKRWFFLKNRPICFHINYTVVITPVTWNKLSFSRIDINKALPAPTSRVF